MISNKFFRCEKDAAEVFNQVSEIFKEFLKVHSHDFHAATMQGLLKIMRKSLEKLPKTPEVAEKLRKVRSAQIWMTRVTRKKTLKKLILCLPEAMMQELDQGEMTYRQQMLGLMVNPILSEADKRQNERIFDQNFASNVAVSPLHIDP